MKKVLSMHCLNGLVVYEVAVDMKALCAVSYILYGCSFSCGMFSVIRKNVLGFVSYVLKLFSKFVYNRLT